jgi:hypothetical protein
MSNLFLGAIIGFIGIYIRGFHGYFNYFGLALCVIGVAIMLRKSKRK